MLIVFVSVLVQVVHSLCRHQSVSEDQPWQIFAVVLLALQAVVMTGMWKPRDLVAEKAEMVQAQADAEAIALQAMQAAAPPLMVPPPWKAAAPPPQAAASSGVAIGALGSRDFNPKKRLVAVASLKEQFDGAKAEPDLGMPQGFVVQIGELDYDLFKETMDEAELFKAAQVAGVYWLIGDNGTKPVYKNPENELQLFYMPGDQAGWYVATEYMETHKNVQAKPEAMYAWLGTGEAPDKMHMPFWSKKALQHSNVVTIVQFHMARILYIVGKL